uniref:Oxidoreductase NAD-binding domain-containing protein 1 n=1 Tax=Phallusia mammillata TaxID=59560 RepID=A0A6F9DN45_9ASCI|nr:oxidoreductase NAD-binding domain-containing protein 1-like [Phallusia mammillata]
MSLRSLQQKLCKVFPRRVYTSITCLFAKDENIAKESKPRTRDHMKRTEHSPRQKSLCTAQVVRIDDFSISIKGLQLFVTKQQRSNAEFKAGQWVDMFIPGVDTVGGFSICNSPKDLQENGIIELAVKFSDHPPAYWIHSKCQLNDNVKVRVGGNFFYEHKPFNNTLLIAGGVGINPLLSIFRHKRDRICDIGDSSTDVEGKTALIYSAKTCEDLIFQKQIQEMCMETNALCHFHVTKEKVNNRAAYESPFTSITETKVSLETISNLTKQLPPQMTNCYICGPPPFIERVEDYLVACGYPKNHIYYEKWW